MKNIVCLSSGGPGNFATTVAFCERHVDRARIVHLISDRQPIPAIDLADAKGIPSSVFHFSDSRPLDSAAFRSRREQECDAVLEFLEHLEAAFGTIDLIVSAFRRVLVGSILERYANRIINVHPADLSVHDVRRRGRRYVGIGGLRKSVADGNEATRTTIHYIDEGVDTGAILCLGPMIAVGPDSHTRSGLAKHETRQKELSDRPALTRALERVLLEQCSDPLVM